MIRIKSLLKSGITRRYSQTINTEAAGGKTVNKKYTLFVTRTCPNCASAERLLEKKGIVYETLAVEQYPELAVDLDLMQAPALVVGTDGKNLKVEGLSNIKKYLEAE